jgi:hypothetical protein
MRSGPPHSAPGSPRKCSDQRIGDPSLRALCRPSHTATIPLPRRELAAWKSESLRLISRFTSRDPARRVSRFRARRMNRDPRRRGSRFRVAARGAIPRAKDHVSCSVAKHDRRHSGPRFVPPPRGDPPRYRSRLATDGRPVSWCMRNRALRGLIADALGRGRAAASTEPSPAGGALVGSRVGTLDTLCRHSTQTVGQLGDDSARSRQPSAPGVY